MIQRPVIPSGLVQVPPTRLVLPGGFTQVPIRPVIAGVATVSGGAAPFTPTDLANKRLWLDASQQTEGDGDPVSTFVDQFNGQSFTGSGTNRPTMDVDAFGSGKPGVLWDGVDDYMSRNADNSDYGWQLPCSMAFTVKPLTDAPTIGGCAVLGDNGVHNVVIGPNIADDVIYIQTVGNSAVTVTAGTPMVVTILVNDGSQIVRANGVEIGSFSVAAGSLASGFTDGGSLNFILGAVYTFNFYSAKAIGDLIVCGGIWDAGTIANVETYLAGKVGIAL